MDKYAIKTTQANFPDTVQLGDAFQVRERKQDKEKESRIKKMERLILQCGWEGLDGIQRRRAEKLLGADRIDALCQMRTVETDAPEEEQTSLFE